MNEPAWQAQIDAANAYEALFVPALFGQWVPTVADSAHIRPGQRVLDVACGTGTLAREILARTGPGGRVVGIDPVPGMLAVAKQLAPGVEWLEGVAESLPFPGEVFDAVVSQFGLMFFSDRCQALREMRRVLLPEGRIVVAVWDALEQMPAYQVEVALLERYAGKPAADALRAPFVMGDARGLRALFDEAGLGATTEIATLPGTARFASIRTMVEADLRGWLPVMGVMLGEEQIGDILQAAEHALSDYAAEDGRVSFELSAHIVSAHTV